MKTRNFDTISVIGLGYIGLPTAAMFAACKMHVVGVDVDAKAVDTVNNGQIHITEPDLDMIVSAAVSRGFLRATTKPEPAQAFLIAVPTPFKGENHDPDLSYIEAAAKSLAPVLDTGNLVVLESTSPIGATERLSEWLSESRPDLTFPQTHGEESDIRVAHCPERVLPGKIMQELTTNDRVIGGMTPKCSERAMELYRTFVTGECVIASSPSVAEMAKLTENSYRDTNIAFANELSMICDRFDLDVWELISLANRHPRVNILQPGPGVGGHCIAVDPWFLVSSVPESTRLIRAAREVNDSKPKWVIEKAQSTIRQHLAAHPGKTIADVVIACYGLAYKPDIDDLRESPSVKICEDILAMHPGRVLAVEPNINELPDRLGRAELTAYESALRTADIHLLLVGHKTFRNFPASNAWMLNFVNLVG